MSLKLIFDSIDGKLKLLGRQTTYSEHDLFIEVIFFFMNLIHIIIDHLGGPRVYH